MNKNIISIDAETNGLQGRAFMIAGVVFENGKIIDQFVGRCPLKNPTDWVKKNVLPQINYIKITHKDFDSLLKDFISWHNQYKQYNSWDNQNGYQTLWHLGQPVETNLFRTAYEKGFIDEFGSPYVPIEMATLLQASGHKPDSVDDYIKQHNIIIPVNTGGTHNALYDAMATAYAYFDLISKMKNYE